MDAVQEGCRMGRFSLTRGRSLGDPIANGTKVRVRGVDGLVLKVEPEPEVLAPND